MINFRIKVREFFKKYKYLIIIIAGVWLLIFIINYILGHLPEGEAKPIVTYEPHTSVMDETSKVPEKLQNPIEEKIKEFIDACNEKNYEKAYELISEDCRKTIFNDDIENLKTYIDTIFNEKKIYNIQNFTNKNGNYIYTVTILEDIMKTGLTGTDSLDEYEETFSMKEENGEIKLSIKGFIESNELNKLYEDDYFRLVVNSVNYEYDTVTYNVSIRNKTDGIIVLEDFSEDFEIAIKTKGSYRKRTGFYREPVIIRTNATGYFDLSFNRFYDEKGQVDSLILNDVRVLKTYSGTEETRQEELDNAIARYGLELELTK